MENMNKKEENSSVTKKKLNIPFLFFTFIFISGIVSMIVYFVLTHKEDKAFDKVRSLLKEETVVDKENDKDNEENKENKEDSLKYYLIDGKIVQEEFKDLYIQNSDIIGWIKIDDTPVDYPVMYTPKDEEFYIHRDFEKNYSFGGCIFAGLGADIERPSDNIITYGHHMADASMYHDIDRYENEDYYKEHKYIRFDTLRQTGIYEVIAAYRTKVYAEEDNYTGFAYWKFVNAGSEKDYDNFIENSKSLTPYTIDTTASYGDQLLTLSTCAYHDMNGRFVVVAKRIEGKEVNTEKEPEKVIEK